jgi:hypothetical protein
MQCRNERKDIAEQGIVARHPERLPLDNDSQHNDIIDAEELALHVTTLRQLER